MKSLPLFGKLHVQIILATTAFFLLIFLIQSLQAKIDLTAEKRFSLNTATKELLVQVDSPVEITVFLTGDLTADYRKLSIATADILSSFKDINPRNIRINFQKPGEDLTDSLRYELYDSLQRMGVVFEEDVSSMSGTDAATRRLIIPSALVSYKDAYPLAIDLRSSRKVFQPYNVIDQEPVEDKEATLNAAEALLEYKFADAISKLTRKQIPVIAYCVGNGQPVDLTVNDLGESLRNQYRLAVFDLKSGYPDPRLINLLLVVKPQLPFTDEDKLKLDQYVMHGGKIIWCIDKLYAEIDSLMRSQSDFVAFDRNLNLDDLFFKYGVRIQNDLLQDLNCSKLPVVIGQNADGSPRIQRIPWAYYPFLTGFEDHTISRNLDRVLSLFPSGIDLLNSSGLQHDILLSTDTNSRRLMTPAMISLNSVKDDNDLAQFNTAHIPVAVMVSGKFQSLFANRLTPAVKDSVSKSLGLAFSPEGLENGVQIFCSDADLVTNGVSSTSGPLPMGTLLMENYRFANREFLLNCIDYMAGNSRIFETRNKDFSLRLLNKEKLQSQKLWWQIINITLPLLFVTLGGGLFSAWLKRTYGTG
jgi:gliding-associated putative ABC transporter substrate-binding component GldG